MTAPERVYRLALHAYPPGYRRERGAEILATLDEMGAGSSRPSPRQVAALAASGVRERGARTTGGTRFGIWAEGCRLAALVLLLLAAAASLFVIAMDAWYSRLGIVWPGGEGVTYAPALGGGALARSIIAVLIPLVGAWAVCRGRSAIPIACSILAAGLFLAGQVGSGLAEGQFVPTGQEWLANAYKLGDALVLSAPAALLCVGIRGDGRRPARRSLLWLAVPVVLGVLRIGLYATSITFWPLGALLIVWFLAARLSPHLAVAAFAVLAATLAYVVPTAIGDAMVYEYAIAVATGAAVLAVASLAAALAGDDAELDTPLM
ncbi:MAG TPA: hypothetical protein VGL44_10680 [Gaiellales bacterium]|jgi:hypothetical protein